MMLIKRLFFHFALYIYLHQGLITGKANGFMLIEKNISFSLSHHHHNNEKQQHDNVVYSTGTSTPRNHQQPVGACDGMNRSKNPNSCKTTLHMSTISDEQFEKISPRKLVQLGMLYFKQGDVDGSITLFDKAEKRDETLSPYLWQRGISYYYADRFQDGSDQFRYDVKVNPLDVEEIVWDIACQYNILSSTNRNDGSKEDAVINMMSLPKGKTDRRKIMVSYKLADNVWMLRVDYFKKPNFLICIHLSRALCILYFEVMDQQSMILSMQVTPGGKLFLLFLPNKY